MTSSWSIADLRASLEELERDLRRAGNAEKTVETYVDRSERFLRYLTGEYTP